MREVVVYIAMSLDGYIAKPNDDLSFLSIVQQSGEDYGYREFIKGVDTVIMGRKTYDWVMTQVSSFPHADKETYIVTRTPKPSIGSTTFYSGSLRELVQGLKGTEGKSIFVDGGAEVVDALLQENLIDRFIISIIPILLGEGVRLFKDGRPETHLKLTGCRSYEKGLVQVQYQRLEQ